MWWAVAGHRGPWRRGGPLAGTGAADTGVDPPPKTTATGIRVAKAVRIESAPPYHFSAGHRSDASSVLGASTIALPSENRSGSLEVAGSSNTVEVVTRGAGQVDLRDFAVATAHVTASEATRVMGAWLRDVDGNEYVDLICSWGPMILGHAHPDVVRAIVDAAARGTSYGAPTELEVRFADQLAPFAGSPVETDLASADPSTFNDDQAAVRMSWPVERVIAEFLDAHQRVMRLAALIAPEVWREIGTIPWYGAEYSLDDLVVYQQYGHKREHDPQLRSLLNLNAPDEYEAARTPEAR